MSSTLLMYSILFILPVSDYFPEQRPTICYIFWKVTALKPTIPLLERVIMSLFTPLDHICSYSYSPTTLTKYDELSIAIMVVQILICFNML